MRLISVGKRLPDWVYTVFAEYNKRLPNAYKLDLTEVSAAARSRSVPVATTIQKEAEAVHRQLPAQAFIVLLDEKGCRFTSTGLATSLEKWQKTGKNICFIIGGADGVDETLRQVADVTWSLSTLTFPHALVRVILAEQIYRAWSINNNHPYHRE